MNLGTLAFFVILYMLKLLMVAILKPLSMIFPNIFKKLYLKSKQQVFFGDAIFMLVQGYFEFIISSTLVVLAPTLSVDKTPLMLNTAYFFLFMAIIALPGLYIWMLTRSHEVIKSKRFQSRWGALLSGINLKYRHNFWNSVFFVIRRMMFVATAFFLRDLGSIQIMLFNY